MDGPGKTVWGIFIILLALSTRCKYDFIHFTVCQWTSTWMLRICHIALTAVPSKTEHRILHGHSAYIGILPPQKICAVYIIELSKCLIITELSKISVWQALIFSSCYIQTSSMWIWTVCAPIILSQDESDHFGRDMTVSMFTVQTWTLSPSRDSLGSFNQK